MYFPNIWVPVCGRAIKILLGGKGTKLFAVTIIIVTASISASEHCSSLQIMADDVGSDLYSVEFKTFKECIPCLEITLTDNLTPILHELNKRGLIKHDAHDKAKEDTLRTPAQKAVLIVSSLKDVIEISSDRFHELIEVLSHKRVANYYKDVVVKLKKTFGRFIY